MNPTKEALAAARKMYADTTWTGSEAELEDVMATALDAFAADAVKSKLQDLINTADEALHSGCTLTEDHPSVQQIRYLENELLNVKSELARMKLMEKRSC